MSDPERLCLGGGETTRSAHNGDQMRADKGQVHRRVVRCPRCNRRLLEALKVVGPTDEGELLGYAVPPHKPKGWKRLDRKRKVNREVRRGQA